MDLKAVNSNSDEVMSPQHYFIVDILLHGIRVVAWGCWTGFLALKRYTEKMERRKTKNATNCILASTIINNAFLQTANSSAINKFCSNLNSSSNIMN